MSENTIPLLFALLCGGFFALVAFGGGIALIVMAQRSRKKAQASQSWPSTVGEIVRSEVGISTDRQVVVGADDAFDEGPRTKYSYYPAVEYVYQVGGTQYRGKQITIGGTIGYNNRTKAEAELKKYPLGKQVTVYYNPEKPSDAVLERQAASAKWLTTVGAILLVIGLCISCGLLVGIVTNLGR